MRRRGFITLVGSTAVVWSFAAHGQPSKPLIGFLRNTTLDESAYLLTALRKGLNETGYVEGENLAIEYRWGGGHQDRLRGLADDLMPTGLPHSTLTGTRCSPAYAPPWPRWQRNTQSQQFLMSGSPSPRAG